jgi:uncharacterized protein YndB with AHSA1/START domain
MTATGGLTYRRVHRGSPELLFDCMTIPEHLTHFWGPTGTTTPVRNIVMRTTITFIDLGDGRTEVVTHQTNVPAAYLSAEARAGFSTSLDRFEAYLAGLDAVRERRTG